MGSSTCARLLLTEHQIPLRAPPPRRARRPSRRGCTGRRAGRRPRCDWAAHEEEPAVKKAVNSVKRAKQAGGRYGYRSFSNHLLLPPLFMLHLRASRCPASSHPIPKSNPRCATPQALLFLSSELNRNLCLPGRPCRAWRAYEYGRGPCRSKPRDSPSTALPD